jgi:hypothetical protein
LENSGLETVANFKFFDRGNELFCKRIIDAGLDIESVGANTGLTGVAIFGNDRSFDRSV